MALWLFICKIQGNTLSIEEASGLQLKLSLKQLHQSHADSDNVKISEQATLSANFSENDLLTHDIDDSTCRNQQENCNQA